LRHVYGVVGVQFSSVQTDQFGMEMITKMEKISRRETIAKRDVTS